MLETIVAATRADLAELARHEAEIRRAAAAAGPARDMASALIDPGLSVIAEFKRASPSRGVLAGRLDPDRQAIAYEQGGAAAISVLTERRHFLGSPDDLSQARQACSLPVLRKDFTLDPIHIWQARAMGADAILLIVAILDQPRLIGLLEAVDEVGVAALVEVHDGEQARRAVDAGGRIIGVNNRDLSTFEVDLSTAESVAPLLEGVAVTVAESGIASAVDARRMHDAGFDAVLVGEHLVRSNDPARAIAELRVT